MTHALFQFDRDRCLLSWTPGPSAGVIVDRAHEHGCADFVHDPSFFVLVVL